MVCAFTGGCNGSASAPAPVATSATPAATATGRTPAEVAAIEPVDVPAPQPSEPVRVEPAATEPRASIAEVTSTSTSWPLFRANPLATGVATSGLPDKPVLLWKFPTDQGAFESTPVIADGVVYIGSLDGNLYAVNLADGAEKWRFHTELGFAAAAAVRDGFVYIGDTEGRFYCLDAATGRAKWGFEAQAEIDSSANFIGDRVLFGSQDASLYCLNAASGELVWKYTIEDQIRCFPTVVDNRAFVAGCDSKLHVIDLTKGEKIASVEIDAPTGTSPAVQGDFVYFGTEGNTFFCINWREARVSWVYQNARAQAYRSSAAVTPATVVVGGRNKLIHALDPQTGDEQWTFATKARVDGSPIIVGQRVYVGGGDGRVYGLDLKTGANVWEYETGGRFSGSPAVAADKLLIGNEDGVLYCFGAETK